MTLLGDLFLCAGSVLLFWGTLALFSKKPVVVKLHALGVGDTLGAFLFVLGLLLRSTEGRGLLTGPPRGGGSGSPALGAHPLLCARTRCRG